MNYAVVVNGVVTNVIVADYYTANKLANQAGGVAINVDQFQVQSGFEYRMKYVGEEEAGLTFFSPEGEEIERIPTADERLDSFMDQMIIDNLVLTEIIDQMILDSLE